MSCRQFKGILSFSSIPIPVPIPFVPADKPRHLPPDENRTGLDWTGRVRKRCYNVPSCPATPETSHTPRHALVDLLKSSELQDG